MPGHDSCMKKISSDDLVVARRAHSRRQFWYIFSLLTLTLFTGAFCDVESPTIIQNSGTFRSASTKARTFGIQHSRSLPDLATQLAAYLEAVQSTGRANLPVHTFTGRSSCGASLEHSMLIAGKGANATIIDCTGTGLRALRVSGGVAITLTGITMKGGSSPTPFLLASADIIAIALTKEKSRSTFDVAADFDQVSAKNANDRDIEREDGLAAFQFARSPLKNSHRLSSRQSSVVGANRQQRPQATKASTGAAPPLSALFDLAELINSYKNSSDHLSNLLTNTGVQWHDLSVQNVYALLLQEVRQKPPINQVWDRGADSSQIVEVPERNNRFPSDPEVPASKSFTSTKSLLNGRAWSLIRKRDARSTKRDIAYQSSTKPPIEIIQPEENELGGCILAVGSDIKLQYSVVDNCSAPYGGGIAAIPDENGASSLDIQHSTVQGCRANQGGAVWATKGRISAMASKLLENSAVTNQSVLHSIDPPSALPASSTGSAFGGALFVALADVSLEALECKNNTAAAVGNSSVAYDNKLTLASGGCLGIIGGTLLIAGGEFVGNTAAARGNGVFAYGGFGTLVGMDGAVLKAGTEGPALYDHNTAISICGTGGNLGCSGQAGTLLVWYCAQFSFSNSICSNSYASTVCTTAAVGGPCFTQGGVLVASKSSQLNIDAVTFKHIQASTACQGMGKGYSCDSVGGVFLLENCAGFRMIGSTVQNSTVSTVCDNADQAVVCSAQGGTMTAYATDGIELIDSAIYRSSTVMTCSSTTSIKSCVSQGGALFLYQKSVAIINGTNLNYCSAAASCGADSYSCSATGGSLFSDTHASFDSTMMSISNSHITCNSISSSTSPSVQQSKCVCRGGALFLQQTDAVITRATISKSLASSNQPSRGSLVSGGGIFCALSNIVCDSCNIINNTVSAIASADGGGISCGGARIVGHSEGVTVQQIVSHLSFTNCAFENNAAKSVDGSSVGGGIHVSSLCSMMIRGSDIRGNEVSGQTMLGAGVAVQSNLTLISAAILNHQLAAEGQGSAIFATQGAFLHLSDSLLRGNQGSSVYAVNGVSMLFQGQETTIQAASNMSTAQLNSYVLGFVGSTSRAIIASNSQWQCNRGYVASVQRQNAEYDTILITQSSQCINLTSRIECPQPEFRPELQQSYSLIVQCQRCQVGTYSLNPNATVNVRCLQCPFGAQCEGSTVLSKNGYWATTLPPQNTVLPSIFDSLPQGYGCPNATCQSYDTCNAGRTGVLCGRCVKGYGARLLSPECGPDSQCHRDQTWFFPLVVVLFNFAAALIVSSSSLFTEAKKQSKRHSDEMSTSLEPNRSRAIAVTGRFTVLLAYLQMSELVISNQSLTQMHAGVSGALAAAFAIGQGGTSTAHLSTGAGICLLPSMTQRGLVAASVTFSLLFAFTVLLWSLAHPRLLYLRSMRRFTSKISSTFIKGVPMHRLSLHPRLYSTYSEESDGLESASGISSSDNTRLRQQDTAASRRAVAFYKTFQIVYQAVLIACVRSLVNVHVSGVHGKRWFYDAETPAGVWQVGPAFMLAILVMLPAVGSLWIEREIQRAGIPDQRNSSSRAEYMFALALYHTAPFKKRCRHWPAVMMYRRVVLVLIVELVGQPVAKRLAVCFLTLCFMIVQWQTKPFVSKSIQRLELSLLSLLCTQAILQVRGASLLSAAAQPAPSNHILNDVLLWLMAISAFCPLLFALLGAQISADFS